MTAPKILFIDDEEDLVMLASSFFEDEGLPIDACSDFKEALKLVEASKYDVIISDSRMPTGTGLELLTTIKTNGWFNGKFILLTGNLESHSEKRQFDYDMILYKPIKFEDLVATVRKLISL